MPASRIATISSEVPTGRRMKMRDGFMRAAPTARRGAVAAGVGARPALPCCAGRCSSRQRPARCCFALSQQHLGTVLELVGAVGDHPLAGLEALLTATLVASPGPSVTLRTLTVCRALTTYT